MARKNKDKKNKKSEKINKFDKYFFLNWKKFLLILGLWFLVVLFHNFFSALFNFEEGFFFITAVIVIPSYFIATAIYTIIKLTNKSSWVKRKIKRR